MSKYKRRALALKILFTVLAAVMAIGFLTPILLTMTNSFMTQDEITANYGVVFGAGESEGTDASGNQKAVTKYISQTVNLKFIPDMVSFKQYYTVLFNSPEYLLKFWNSVFLTVPVAVSYTHLDVYKRQNMGMSFRSSFRLRAFSAAKAVSSKGEAPTQKMTVLLWSRPRNFFRKVFRPAMPLA